MIKYNNCENVSIENLYTSRNNDNPHKVEAIFKDNPHRYGVILDGRDNTPDCNVSSFGDNLYFRTPKGQNRQIYKTVKTMAQAIKKTAKKYGLELDYLEVSKGEPATI